jgi:hypothetical protein
VGDRCTVLVRTGGAWRRVEHAALSAVCADAPDLRAVWAGAGDPWVVGSRGGVYRIGLESARRVTAPPSAVALTAVWGRGGEVFAVSEDGAVLRCSDDDDCAAERAADGKVLRDVWARAAGEGGEGAGEAFAVGEGGLVLARGPGGSWGTMGEVVPELKGLARLRVRGGPGGVWIAGGGTDMDFSATVLRLSGGRWLAEPGASQGYPPYALWIDPGGQPWIAGWGGTVLRRMP